MTLYWNLTANRGSGYYRTNCLDNLLQTSSYKSNRPLKKKPVGPLLPCTKNF